MSALGSLVFALAFGLSLYILYRTVRRLVRDARRLLYELQPQVQRARPDPEQICDQRIEWREAA